MSKFHRFLIENASQNGGQDAQEHGTATHVGPQRPPKSPRDPISRKSRPLDLNFIKKYPKPSKIKPNFIKKRPPNPKNDEK